MLMDDELEVLISAAARSAWAEEPSVELIEAIEQHIVVPLPHWMKTVLGRDEAAQLARVIAWRKCQVLAVNPPRGGVSWGYLANHVRWRVKDAALTELRHRQRFPLTPAAPDSELPELPTLGLHLEQIVAELERHGISSAIGRQLVRTAADGPPFYRAAIISRLRGIGVTRSRAEGLAWLLRGGAARPSALARLAAGQAPEQVFADPAVRNWLKAATGRDLLFFGQRTSENRWNDLARSA
ncbi:hypothetical protein GCM10009554_43080 [Kribbella koreensis]|uniref:Uncharacterized protein n=2 Tax=Kribbella koreensis TaxID=57909 RepID=A0ABN1QSI8_9ACTN